MRLQIFIYLKFPAVFFTFYLCSIILLSFTLSYIIYKISLLVLFSPIFCLSQFPVLFLSWQFYPTKSYLLKNSKTKISVFKDKNKFTIATSMDLVVLSLLKTLNKLCTPMAFTANFEQVLVFSNLVLYLRFVNSQKLVFSLL